VLVVAAADAERAITALNASGETAHLIGSVEPHAAGTAQTMVT